jgi:hypothetical protein
MRRKSCALPFVAVGALLIAAPSPGNIGGGSLYDQALAEKGGNGKGRGGGNSNNGGNRSAGKNGGSNATTNFAADQTGKQELALTDPSHPSMLGRWNAAKPLDHPAIQAHIRNGNFQGTIGMVAAYVQAQTAYNSLQDELAQAQSALDSTDMATLEQALADALAGTQYDTEEAYDAAVAENPDLANPEVEAAQQAIADYQTAEQLVAESELALDDLETAEANMVAYSNRAPWSEIREAVREKMGLEPAENDLATATSTETAQQ